MTRSIKTIHDLALGSFVIIENTSNFFLSQVKSINPREHEAEVLYYEPSLRELSSFLTPLSPTRNTAPITITKILLQIIKPLMPTKRNQRVLSKEQYYEILDACNDFSID